MNFALGIPGAVIDEDYWSCIGLLTNSLSLDCYYCPDAVGVVVLFLLSSVTITRFVPL